MPFLLLTRPAHSNLRFLRALSSEVRARAEVVQSPLLEIVATGAPCDLDPKARIIFTSPNGVRFGPDGAGRTVYCVGEKTAEAAMERRWHVGHVAQTAQELIASLISKRVEGPLHHLAGRHRRGEIAERLTAAGVPTTVVTLYEQRALRLSPDAQAALCSGRMVIAPVFSPRTAKLLVQDAGSLARCLVIAISASVSEVFEGAVLEKLLVAKAPTGKDMRVHVENLLSDTSLT